MMCNPNPTIQPTGSTPSGSPTGNQSQITNPFLSDQLGLLEKSAHEIAVRVAQLRSEWLKKQLKERGMPETLLDGVHNGEPGMMRLAAHWLRLYGFAFATRSLNTIQLYQHGELLADETLFKAPLSYDPASDGYRTALF